MVTILSSGTLVSLKLGLRSPRRKLAKITLGEDSKTVEQMFRGIKASMVFSEEGLDVTLDASSKRYVREVSLKFKYISKRPIHKTAIWCESGDFPVGKNLPLNIPGALTTGVRRRGGGALWIAASDNFDGLFFSQTSPKYPLSFDSRPFLRTLEVTWTVNRVLLTGGKLRLSRLRMQRGQLLPLSSKWIKNWAVPPRQEIVQSRGKGWQASNTVASIQDVRQALSELKTRNLKIDWFSIAPIYAKQVGDWLSPTNAFRDQMNGAARQINDAAMLPGIRFAPFLVSRNSEIAQKKRSWLVKSSKNGALLTVPSYAGSKTSCYVLDVTLSPVLNNLKKTFSQIKDQWGYRVFQIERIRDALLPGIRSDNRNSADIQVRRALEVLREGLGDKILLITSDERLFVANGIWDMWNGGIWGVNTPTLKAKEMNNYVLTLLNRTRWNSVTPTFYAGPMPLELFESNTPAAATLQTAMAISSGMVVFSGDPRKINKSSLEKMHRFLGDFQQYRTGRLTVEPFLLSRKMSPLMVRDNQNWLVLFNFSGQKSEMQLDKTNLEKRLGVVKPLKAGDGATFNSPEIRIILDPRGHRVFKG